MAEALACGDRQEFFRILATTRLHLPVVTKRPGAGRRLLTLRLMGRIHVVAHTSPAALTASLGGRTITYAITDYSELRARWPTPTWRLAINPGLPLDAYTEMWALGEAAAGQVTMPSAADLMAEQARQPDAVRQAAGLLARLAST